MLETTPASCPRCGSPLLPAAFGLCPVCTGRAMLDSWDSPEESETLQEATGLTLGQYDLLEELGRGAMGAVYRARHQRLGREVALKVILAGQFAGQAERRRFLVEAEAAAQLDHPNLVALFEQGEEAGRLYYAMQLIRGPTLAARLKKEPLSACDAATLIAKCARAVHHAHERGVLHRDLKPGNVILDANGEPHVADFGLARRLDHDASLTIAGSLLGSPAYMAPEMAAGAPATSAADTYSLGSMLYELLRGAPPFTAPTITELLVALREQDPPSLRPRGIDGDLESICFRCLEKDPTQRYPSTLTLAEDLDRWLRGEPVEARPSTPLQRAIKWARRRPAIAALSALALLLFVAGSAGIAWQWRHAVHETGSAVSARHLAESREIETRRALYAADMNLCQAALKANNLGRARSLLDAHRPAPGELDLRGWEWRYLWVQCRSHALDELPRAAREVKGVALSLDGRLAFANDDGGHLRSWDTEKRAVIRDLGKRNGGPLAVSPDGTLLLVPLNSETMELRRFDDSRVLPLLAGTLTDAAFSPDGTLVASQNFAGTTRVWKTENGEQVTEIKDQKINAGQGGAVAFLSGSVPRLATGNSAGMVRLYRLSDWQLDREWQAFPKQSVSALAASPDGRWLVAGGCFDDPVLRVLDTTTTTPVANLAGHSSWISTLLFSPDGARLYSASADQTIRVWNTADWTPSGVLRGHRDEIWSLGISGDGKRLISGSKNGEVLEWSAEPGLLASERFDFPPEVNEVMDAAASGDLLTTRRSQANEFSRWKPGPWSETPFSLPPEKSRRSLSPAGFFAEENPAGSATLCSFASIPPVELATFPAPPFDQLIAERGYPQFALMRRNGSFTLWDSRSQGSRELPPLSVKVTVARLDPLGQRLLALGADHSIFRYDFNLAKWLEPLPLPATKGRLFLDRSATWVVETLDRTVRIFRAEPTFREVGSFEAENPAPSVAFSPDGQWLAVANEGAVARLWRLKSTGPLPAPRVLRGHLNAIHGVVFTDDSTRLVTSCSNLEAAKFWDVETGLEVLTLPGRSSMLYFTRFYANGEVLVGSGQPSGGSWQAWHAPSLQAIDHEEAAAR